MGKPSFIMRAMQDNENQAGMAVRSALGAYQLPQLVFLRPWSGQARSSYLLGHFTRCLCGVRIGDAQPDAYGLGKKQALPDRKGLRLLYCCLNLFCVRAVQWKAG